MRTSETIVATLTVTGDAVGDFVVGDWVGALVGDFADEESGTITEKSES